MPVVAIMEAYTKHPERFIPFYAPDPKRSDLHAVLDQYISKGILGIGELKVNHKWDSETIENYLPLLHNYKLPLLFHMEVPKYIYIPKNENYLYNKWSELLNGAFNGVSKEILYKISDFLPPLKSHIKNNSVYFPGYLFDFVG